MTVEFAHPFAEDLLSQLLAGQSVGRALLHARRHFISLRNPLGLAYSLFGSADGLPPAKTLRGRSWNVANQVR